MKNKKGFTLSEILVVLALISVILLIVIPSVLLITRRINKRLLEGKKEVILAAAEIYGKDNSLSFGNSPSGELEIIIETLLKTGYIEPDEKEGDSHCPSGNTNGCIINPVNKENLNDTPIMIIKKNDTYTAVWDETNSGQEAVPLINLVCDKLANNYKKQANLTVSNSINSSNYNCTCIIDNDEYILKNQEDPNSANLTVNDSSNASCYFKDEDPKNWLYYSEKDFRVMGIEKIDGTFYVKIITNDNI